MQRDKIKKFTFVWIVMILFPYLIHVINKLGLDIKAQQTLGFQYFFWISILLCFQIKILFPPQTQDPKSI